jgi:hypothetical protein
MNTVRSTRVEWGSSVRKAAVLAVCCFAASLAAISWISWPDRTWNSFTLALEAREDATAANSLCDGDRLRVVRIDESLYLGFRVSSDGEWLRYPLESLYGGDLRAFRAANGPMPTSIWQTLAAAMPVTAPRSIGPGHLEVRRGRITFELD